MPDPTPRLTHVILRVADLQRSLRFWRDTLGLRPLGAFESFAFLDAGGVRIGLNAVAPPPEQDGGLATLTEVVLEVPDVRATHADLAARGVHFRTAPRPVAREGARELLACDCRDPDGHLLSIAGWVPAA